MVADDRFPVYAEGFFRDMDIQFARLMNRLDREDLPELFTAAALVSGVAREGNVCLDLSTVAGKPFPNGEEGRNSIICPELSYWHGQLRTSTVVGIPGEYKPLILDEKYRLYLYRYWEYQEKLAILINQRVGEVVRVIDQDLLKEGLNRLFPDDREDDINWQKVAAYAALRKNITVISGGPGTGKTATVVKILALLLEQERMEKLRIALAAPTGKAAARLQEIIENSLYDLNCSETIKVSMRIKASTVHRLLGTIRQSPYFRYNENNKLPVDLVVVDEASMIDLPLMSKLFQAVPLQSRVILLGDKDQLASVEAGAVLGDICDAGTTHHFSELFCKEAKAVMGYELPVMHRGHGASGLQDCIVELRKSYRFGSGSGISGVSRAVNAGDDDQAVALLRHGRFEDISWTQVPLSNDLPALLRDRIAKEFHGYLTAVNYGEVFRRFNDFRILCAVREGPYGVRAINRMIEDILGEENLIDPQTPWYRGRPIMITRNDYDLHLFNGDVGVILPDPMTGNEPRAFFPVADGTARKVHPLRLPEHETVYAMTIHKSQGSEFRRILLLLPNRYSPVLTRELLYTGITRAKEHVALCGSEDVFRSAIAKRIVRTSGLRDALWRR